MGESFETNCPCDLLRRGAALTVYKLRYMLHCSLPKNPALERNHRTSNFRAVECGLESQIQYRRRVPSALERGRGTRLRAAQEYFFRPLAACGRRLMQAVHAAVGSTLTFRWVPSDPRRMVPILQK